MSKKSYIQPQTTAIQVAFEQHILTGSDGKTMTISNDEGDQFLSNKKDYSSEIWGE